MTLPVFGVAGTYLTGTSATAAVAVPSGVTAGQVILVHLYKESTATVTPPSGFTELTPAPFTTSSVHTHHVFWKRATGSDSGTYSFTWSGSTFREAVAIRYTGCATSGVPVDVFNTAARSTNGTVTPAVSLTTTGADRLLEWAGSNFNAGSWTPPSGFTERVDAAGCLSVATLGQSTAGSTGSVTGTCSGSSSETGWLLALLPVNTAVTITDDTPGQVEAGSPTDDSFSAVPDFVNLNDPDVGQVEVVAPAGESVDVSLVADDATAAIQVDGSASDEAVGVSVDDSPSSQALLRSGTDETVLTEEPGLPAGGKPYISVWLVDRTTGGLVPLPHALNVDLNPQRNSPGSWQIEYPAFGKNFELLRSEIEDNRRRCLIEFWVDGRRFNAQRGLALQASGDDVAENSTWTFGGHFNEWRMTDGVVYPVPANPNGEKSFSAATPGTVMRTLMQEAQAKGTLADVTFSTFSQTVDSAGVTWAKNITAKFTPQKTSLLNVLDRLVDLGLCEWEVTLSNELKLYNPGGLGRDLTTRNPPTRLKRATSLLESQRRIDLRDVATDLYGTGADGLYSAAHDSNARSRIGAQIERSVDSNNLDSQAALDSFVQNSLPTVTEPVIELTHGLVFGTDMPAPVSGFRVHDWLYSDVGRGLERVRVVAWNLTQSVDDVTGSVTLNDVIGDRISRLQKQLAAMSDGSATVGTSTSTTDTGVPNPPTSLAVSSLAFLVGSEVRAAVQVGWTAPTTNVDGTTITDLAGYTVEYGFGLFPTVWNAGATVNSGSAVQATFSTAPRQTIAVRAYAFDTAGNVSVASDPVTHTTATDVTPPPTCSTPTVANYLGVLRITWDGKTSTGADMFVAAADFDHAEVHISTAAAFTPDTTTYFDRLFARGTAVYIDGVYGTTYYARLVPVDGSGNVGTASGVGSDTPQKLVQIDVGPDAIGRAQIIDGEIVNAKIALLAVQDENVANLNVGKLTAGTMTADILLAGRIRTDVTGSRVEIDDAGLRLYNTAGTTVVDLKTVDGSALVIGEFRTALTGQRVVFNPGGAVPDTLNFYPSGAGDFARIMARTAPADGSAAILIDGGAANGSSRGRVGAYGTEAFISYVTNDTGGDTSAGFSRVAVSAGSANITAWAQTAMTLDRYNGNTFLSASRMRFTWVAGGSGANCPTIIGDQPGAGIKFDSGTVAAVNGAGSSFVGMNASSFNVVSSQEAKTDIADLSEEIDALAVVAGAPSKRWKYRPGYVGSGERGHVRFGPVAEELPASLHRKVHVNGEETVAVSLSDMVGVLWGAVNELREQLNETKGKNA